MADILAGGPDPAPTRRHRRRTTLAGAVVLAGVAALLAARSASGPAGNPPEASPTSSAAAAAPAAVWVAVGSRWAYVVVAACDSRAAPVCSYHLRRRDLGGSGWTTLPLRTDPRSEPGLLPAVIVSGDDVVSVIESPEQERVYTSLDGGDTFTRHDMVPGPPVDGIPESGLLQGWHCPGCGDRLTVLEPETGRLRPLRAQPPLGSGPLRSLDQRGDVLWAVAADRAVTTTAASTDRGRTWRQAPVPGLVVQADGGWPLPLVGPNGRSYLVATRRDADLADQIAGVWQADRPGGPWLRLPARGPRTLLSALAGDRGLLVTEVNGALWRLGAAGNFGRLPDSGPLRPGVLVTGPSRVLASLSPDDASRNTVLLSWDEGETWRVEKVT